MNVILYTTHCPKCVVLEKKLNSAEIEFNIVEDEEKIKEKGFMSVPMLEVDGEVMSFTEANEWVNERL